MNLTQEKVKNRPEVLAGESDMSVEAEVLLFDMKFRNQQEGMRAALRLLDREIDHLTEEGVNSTSLVKVQALKAFREKLITETYARQGN